ncbi:hypothetical protein C8F04DRAFT_1262268 [Mycena alexandri]|uniref:RNase H type-1 domain-containing protein n=1 Tax=Mycena alexandri TaxID=1745969 RepID=A0AAD6SQA3_9AGAR|nr:hypothetical protein C8F04DRAFT_1262268 [Mycena alexandri]
MHHTSFEAAVHALNPAGALLARNAMHSSSIRMDHGLGTTEIPRNRASTSAPASALTAEWEENESRAGGCSTMIEAKVFLDRSHVAPRYRLASPLRTRCLATSVFGHFRRHSTDAGRPPHTFNTTRVSTPCVQPSTSAAVSTLAANSAQNGRERRARGRRKVDRLTVGGLLDPDRTQGQSRAPGCVLICASRCNSTNADLTSPPFDIRARRQLAANLLQNGREINGVWGDAGRKVDVDRLDDGRLSSTVHAPTAGLDQRRAPSAHIEYDADEYTPGKFEREQIVRPLGRGQGCEGEMESLLEATGSAIRGGQVHILCVADSQAALRGVLSTTPRSGQFRAITYDQLIRTAQLHSPHLTITNLWTPAHIGMVGNELADEAARAATEMEADPALFVSLTTVQRSIRVQTLQKWQSLWDRSKTGKSLRAVDKSPPYLTLSPLYTLLSLSRKTISIISRLRTGPSHLNAHRFKSGFIVSPACEACGDPSESRAHYLLQCLPLEPLRQPLHDATRSAGHFGSLHIATLLSEPKVFKALGAFIEASGRFEGQ